MAIAGIAADFLGAGSLLKSDGLRPINIELSKLLDATGADRASYSVFIDGDREMIAAISVGGVENVPRANRIVSIQETGYSEVYAAHLRKECFFYKPKEENQSSLDVGMNRLGAVLFISCPTYKPEGHVLRGAIAVSFDHTTEVDKAKIEAELSAAGAAIEAISF